MQKPINITLKKYSILLLFLLLCAMIYLMPISSAFVAQGFFSYDGDKRKIQHLEGGVVEKVMVKNGDFVKKNQEIIILSSLKAGVDKNIVSWKLLSLILQKQILELEGKKVKGQAISSLDSDIKLILKSFDDEARQKFGYLILVAQEYLKSSINKYLEDIEIFEAKKKILNKSIYSYQKKLKITESQIKNLKFLLGHKLVDENSILDLEKQALELESQIYNSTKEINILENQKQIFRDENIINISQKIMEVVFEVQINKENLRATQDVLSRVIVKSPIDGFIEDLKFDNQGEIVKASEILMQIVPINPHLVVIGKVKPADIDNIKINQIVDLNLKNFYEKNIPKIAGFIFEIANDIRFDNELNEYYYEIKIEVLDNEIIAKKNLKAGMVVDIFVNQNKRNIFSYILSPILKSMKKSFNDLQ